MEVFPSYSQTRDWLRERYTAHGLQEPLLWIQARSPIDHAWIIALEEQALSMPAAIANPRYRLSTESWERISGGCRPLFRKAFDVECDNEVEWARRQTLPNPRMYENDSIWLENNWQELGKVSCVLKYLSTEEWSRILGVAKGALSTIQMPERSFSALAGICIVEESPVALKTKKLGGRAVLHCENGPALAYSDGVAVYALNGVYVSRELVETPSEQLDLQRNFAREWNVEIRKEVLKKVGLERLCQKLGAKSLDKKGSYELLAVELGGWRDGWPVLRMENPSTGTYHIEFVDRSCRTVEQALNFRNGGEFEHVAPIT